MNWQRINRFQTKDESIDSKFRRDDLTRIEKTSDLGQIVQTVDFQRASTPKKVFQTISPLNPETGVANLIDSDQRSRQISTNEFIQREIFGEEKRLIQMIADFEAERVA